MDPLADILRSLSLTGGVFFEFCLAPPWCLSSDILSTPWRPPLAAPARMIGFHFVLEGECHAFVAGEAPLCVGAGEIILLPRNDPHMLAPHMPAPHVRATRPGLAPLCRRNAVPPAAGATATVVHGGTGPVTRMIFGVAGCRSAANPLLDALPPVLKVALAHGAAREWIEASLHHAAAETGAGHSATSPIMSRLSELLIGEAIRQYAATGSGEIGWLRGLGDSRIGPALALIHKDIAAAWSAESLAHSVGLSRSGFVERFSALVGLPPIRYVTVARLAAAKTHLRDGSQRIGRIALLVGYESEEAFSRAFKREFGLSPRFWREQALHPAA